MLLARLPQVQAVQQRQVLPVRLHPAQAVQQHRVLPVRLHPVRLTRRLPVLLLSQLLPHSLQVVSR
ncbi:hypothetical protein Lpp7_12224 [Lacticaseibacillus paracasei subsp. paracasei Lpp7]|uniref:Uncharacterized protein n=1 Tax=Lacticaseibacillus paracasei subsp. paracasei Lpp7 TaxID=1256200 RepID=A0A8E0IE66_LACPA|nr:hypothetical protein Lpp7_12224 [Lacticaseibacillus paracasei subsp. paracasei Lpp7]